MSTPVNFFPSGMDQRQQVKVDPTAVWFSQYGFENGANGCTMKLPQKEILTVASTAMVCSVPTPTPPSGTPLRVAGVQAAAGTWSYELDWRAGKVYAADFLCVNVIFDALVEGATYSGQVVVSGGATYSMVELVDGTQFSGKVLAVCIPNTASLITVNMTASDGPTTFTLVVNNSWSDRAPLVTSSIFNYTIYPFAYFPMLCKEGIGIAIAEDGGTGRWLYRTKPSARLDVVSSEYFQAEGLVFFFDINTGYYYTSSSGALRRKLFEEPDTVVVPVSGADRLQTLLTFGNYLYCGSSAVGWRFRFDAAMTPVTVAYSDGVASTLLKRYSYLAITTLTGFYVIKSHIFSSNIAFSVTTSNKTLIQFDTINEQFLAGNSAGTANRVYDIDGNYVKTVGGGKLLEKYTNSRLTPPDKVSTPVVRSTHNNWFATDVALVRRTADGVTYEVHMPPPGCASLLASNMYSQNSTIEMVCKRTYQDATVGPHTYYLV